MIRIVHVLFALVLLLNAAPLVLCQDSNTTGAGSKNVVIPDPLVRMLIAKGVLTENEGRSISESVNATEQRDRLADLLREKGLISSAEYDTVRTGAPIAAPVALSAKSNPETADTVKREQPPTTPQAAATPSVIAAVAPTRLLPIDLPKREGLIPDIKLGTGARVKLYGFFKTSIIHDSSSPQGNDFPLPLLAGDIGPNSSPELSGYSKFYHP